MGKGNGRQWGDMSFGERPSGLRCHDPAAARGERSAPSPPQSVCAGRASSALRAPIIQPAPSDREFRSLPCPSADWTHLVRAISLRGPRTIEKGGTSRDTTELAPMEL